MTNLFNKELIYWRIYKDAYPWEIEKMCWQWKGENRHIKERIYASVAKMEKHHEELRQNQREINGQFVEIGKMLAIWLRDGQKHFALSPFLPTTENNSILRQQILQAPIWAIDLFEWRQFRNGNSVAQCMECGQKFATTDEAAMGWHIVQKHPQYAAKLLEKQLEKDAQKWQRTNGTERKRKGTEEQKKWTKLFRDL